MKTVGPIVGLLALCWAGTLRADDCIDGGNCKNAPRNIDGATAIAAGIAGAAVGTAVLSRRKKKDSWVRIRLLDANDQPAAGEQFRILLPSGEVRTGTLDAQGMADIEGIEPGTCQVSFPNMDADAWRPAG